MELRSWLDLRYDQIGVAVAAFQRHVECDPSPRVKGAVAELELYLAEVSQLCFSATRSSFQRTRVSTSSSRLSKTSFLKLKVVQPSKKDYMTS